MVILTAAEGEEIVIDGHIRIRVLAIRLDEVCLEVNFPEFHRCGKNRAAEQWKASSRWPAGSA